MPDYFDFIKNQKQNATGNPPVANPNGQQLVTNHKQPSSNLDLMTHLTQRSNRVFMTAQTKAKELGSDLIDSEHLLHGLLSDNEIYNLFVS